MENKYEKSTPLSFINMFGLLKKIRNYETHVSKAPLKRPDYGFLLIILVHYSPTLLSQLMLARCTTSRSEKSTTERIWYKPKPLVEKSSSKAIASI